MLLLGVVVFDDQILWDEELRTVQVAEKPGKETQEGEDAAHASKPLNNAKLISDQLVSRRIDLDFQRLLEQILVGEHSTRLVDDLKKPFNCVIKC